MVAGSAPQPEADEPQAQKAHPPVAEIPAILTDSDGHCRNYSGCGIGFKVKRIGIKNRLRELF